MRDCLWNSPYGLVVVDSSRKPLMCLGPLVTPVYLTKGAGAMVQFQVSVPHRWTAPVLAWSLRRDLRDPGKASASSLASADENGAREATPKTLAGEKDEQYHNIVYMYIIMHLYNRIDIDFNFYWFQSSSINIPNTNP